MFKKLIETVWHLGITLWLAGWLLLLALSGIFASLILLGLAKPLKPNL